MSLTIVADTSTKYVLVVSEIVVKVCHFGKPSSRQGGIL